MSVQISQLPNITSTQLTSGTTTSLSMPLIARVASGNVTTYQTSFSNLKTYVGTGNFAFTGNLGVGTTSALAGSVGGATNFLANSNGITIVKSQTTSTTGVARFDLSTATPNSYAILSLTDNSGSPFLQLSTGSGVLNMYYTAPTHIWRNLSNTERMRVDSSGNLGIVNNLSVNSNTTVSSLTVNNSATISSTLGVTGNVILGSNLGVDGGTVTVFDSIVDLHTYSNLAPWTFDDGKDVGVRMHYYKGADTLAFFGIENTSNTLQYLQNATETSSNVTGTFGNVQFGSLLLSNSTVSANTTTGALRVVGGIGVGGDINAGGNVLVTGTGNVGYGTGAGGTVTQGTGRATGVTINKPTGNIILFTAAGNTTPTTFTVTNSFVANTDVIILNQRSGTNIYLLWVSNIVAGSFNITAYTTGGVTSEAPVINFAVIKGVTA